MARNGSGTYSLPAGNPVVTGTTIQSTWANNTLSDIATALTQSLSQDGQTPVTANLPMGGFKLTGLAAGTTAGDSVRYEQFASPPAIGGTAAAAGSFTTLSASSTVSGTGFSTYLASPPAIGGTAAAAGNFTTLGATGQITSTVATGTAPFVVASTTEVTNLHAATATTATSLAATLAIAAGGTGQTSAAAAFLALAGTQSIADPGYMHLGGVLLQWGTTGAIGTNTAAAVSFPTTFPTACLHVFLTVASGPTNNCAFGSQAYGLGTTGFTVHSYASDGSTAPTYRYLAIGY